MGAAAIAAALATPANADKPADAAHAMSGVPATWIGHEQIVLLAYPGMTALDLVGPHYMFTSLMGATTKLVARTAAPVRSDTGLVLTPDLTFATCPAEVDIICVPGGTTGTLLAMEDAETIAFLKDRGGKARFVTAVCTGSLILGAAGLLDGYRATSHWVTRRLLPIFGATPVDARVVRDRNRITAAGVTAGLDFGLSLVAELRDPAYAQGVQLLAEYAPEPPFNAGTTATAPAATRQMLEEMFAGFMTKAEDTSRRAMALAKPR
jgi:putative intracellular protease/amidase